MDDFREKNWMKCATQDALHLGKDKKGLQNL